MISKDPPEVSEDEISEFSTSTEEMGLQLAKHSFERDEKLRKNMLWAVIGFFWFLSLILAVAIFAFAWHKLTPEKWCFLEKAQVENIQTFLLSGALTAFLSSVGRNMIDLYKGEHSKKK